MRVTPLLNVHRTEEQLKATTEELQMMRLKMEKLELERNTLKMDNEKLEIKVSRFYVQQLTNHHQVHLSYARGGRTPYA